MRIMRRATAVFAEILMIQFVIISGSLGCPLAGAFVNTVPVGHVQAESNASEDDAAGALHEDGAPTRSHAGHTPDSAPASNGEHGGSHHSHSHCDIPCAPAGCVGVMHCSGVAATTTRAAFSPDLTTRDIVRVESVQVPLSVATAPDTPPPRA